jgi:hypothetical protein
MGYAELYTHNKGEMTVIKNNYSLKSEWQELCNKYLKKFCEKHEYTYEADCWVANDPGTIANIGDMFVSMDNIRYDIDNCIDVDCFEAWYWKSLEVYELTGQKYMNYSSFCHGAPDMWSEERLNSVREAKRKVEVAKQNLEKEIERLKNETM